MEHVLGIGKLKKISESLTIGQFRIVRRFSIEQAGDAAVIQCRLATNQFDPPLAMDLRFDGVTRLKIEDWGGPEFGFGGFDVMDISAKGWERIAWEVIDYEYGRVHRYAEDWQILDVTRI
jgi:hypothetical protein